MIQIRNRMFETNSSSVHALIIDKDAEEHLSSTIDLSADNSIGDITRELVRDLDEADTRRFVNWLYSHGVKTIKYCGSNKWLNDFAEMYKDNYSDVGVPDRLSNFNSGALINLLMGHYYDFIGRDDEYDGYNKVMHILAYE